MTAPSPAGLSPLLDQLDEARAKGTPGPWKIRDDGVTVEIEGGDRESVRDKHGFHDPDAALIVAAVNALPQLTAAIRAVLALADEWENDDHPEGWNYSDGIRTALAEMQTGQHTTDEERA